MPKREIESGTREKETSRERLASAIERLVKQMEFGNGMLILVYKEQVEEQFKLVRERHSKGESSDDAIFQRAHRHYVNFNSHLHPDHKSMLPNQKDEALSELRQAISALRDVQPQSPRTTTGQ